MDSLLFVLPDEEFERERLTDASLEVRRRDQVAIILLNKIHVV